MFQTRVRSLDRHGSWSVGSIWLLHPGRGLANFGRLCMCLPVQLDCGEWCFFYPGMTLPSSLHDHVTTEPTVSADSRQRFQFPDEDDIPRRCWGRANIIDARRFAVSQNAVATRSVITVPCFC